MRDLVLYLLGLGITVALLGSAARLVYDTLCDIADRHRVRRRERHRAVELRNRLRFADITRQAAGTVGVDIAPARAAK